MPQWLIGFENVRVFGVDPRSRYDAETAPRAAPGVHIGYVLKGRWHYLEHDWVAEEGGYVYEPPGETHTLVVPEDVKEMITLFQVNGIMLYVDPDGNALGYEDVFSKIAMCRRHYASCGLGADYVERFIR